MQTIKLMFDAVPLTFTITKTGNLAPLGLPDPAFEVKIATMGDKTGETGILAPLGLANPALEVKIDTTNDKTGILAPLGLKVKIATTKDKTGILAPLGLANPSYEVKISATHKTGSLAPLGLANPALEVKIGSKDVDSLGLAGPAMTVNIGIKNIDSLGLAKAYEQPTPRESCRLCAGPKDIASVDRLGKGYSDCSNIHYRCMACPPTVNALAANGDATDDEAMIDYINGLN